MSLHNILHFWPEITFFLFEENFGPEFLLFSLWYAVEPNLVMFSLRNFTLFLSPRAPSFVVGDLTWR